LSENMEGREFLEDPIWRWVKGRRCENV
jgi:hypothetical protein